MSNFGRNQDTKKDLGHGKHMNGLSDTVTDRRGIPRKDAGEVLPSK
jgi:hypothetical protein